MDWLKLGFRQLLRYVGSLLLIITHYFFGTDGRSPQVLSQQAFGNERDVCERSGASMRDPLETFPLLARAAAQMRDNWQA